PDERNDADQVQDLDSEKPEQETDQPLAPAGGEGQHGGREEQRRLHAIAAVLDVDAERPRMNHGSLHGGLLAQRAQDRPRRRGDPGREGDDHVVVDRPGRDEEVKDDEEEHEAQEKPERSLARSGVALRGDELEFHGVRSMAFWNWRIASAIFRRPPGSVTRSSPEALITTCSVSAEASRSPDSPRTS